MAHWSDIPLLTTAVGSYPPGDLAPKRAVQRAVEDQIAAGIDLISDGQVRTDIISLFAAGIPGFQQAQDGVWELFAPPTCPVNRWSLPIICWRACWQRTGPPSKGSSLDR